MTSLEQAPPLAKELERTYKHSFATELENGSLPPGLDDDAIGKLVPFASELPAEVSRESLRGLVLHTPKTCYDLEIPVDTVELGLVHICDVRPREDGEFRIEIKMALTVPGCGMGEMLVDEIREKLLALPRAGEVESSSCSIHPGRDFERPKPRCWRSVCDF